MAYLPTYNKAFEDIKSRLARSLKETLRDDCDPPPDEIHIPYHKILADEDGEENTATATVTYIVFCPKEKRHTVYIKFKYDRAGKFLKDTMTYV